MKILIMGLTGSGKTTRAEILVEDITATGGGVEGLNADQIRAAADEWDFTEEGRIRQAERMAKFALDAETMNKVVVADFVCPTAQLRTIFNPDIVIWMDTIAEGRFEDTNQVFEKPEYYDYRVIAFSDNTRWSELIIERIDVSSSIRG
jgi:adenylylsulfate kinase